MADLQLGVGVRNAKADALEDYIGPSPVVKIFTGAKPANCAAPDSGTLLCQGVCPADWLDVAAGGTKSKLGTWSFTAEAGIGTQNAGHFRMYSSSSPSECVAQGSVSTTAAATGSMTLDSVAITQSQGVTVDTFQLTEGNA